MYSIKGFNYMDLLTDGESLWVIYTTEESNGDIVILKIDPYTLQPIMVDRTSTNITGVMNCFMVRRTVFS